MRAARLFALVLVSIVAASSCSQAPRGGAPELQLVAATTSGDLGKVKALLASGADPNKSVEVDGRQQSAWYLALKQVRPRRPDLVEIVAALLRSGADPKSAWGTPRTGPSESFWKAFLGPSRRSGARYDNPLDLAMMNPVPEVIRALIAAGNDPRAARSALASAVEAGDLEIVHMLVEAGVDVNTTAGATTPLLAAIEARNVTLMIYLEDHGAREKP
ncbi:MAG TPA: ankyrin repeat domain-containing protein [Thermoanaerobaculia bacterium]|nr:ankyrin repeat domain-containing protein [Thermoanaerobaculia bacterium]